MKKSFLFIAILMPLLSACSNASYEENIVANPQDIGRSMRVSPRIYFNDEELYDASAYVGLLHNDCIEYVFYNIDQGQLQSPFADDGSFYVTLSDMIYDYISNRVDADDIISQQFLDGEIEWPDYIDYTHFGQRVDTVIEITSMPSFIVRIEELWDEAAEYSDEPESFTCMTACSVAKESAILWRGWDYTNHILYPSDIAYAANDSTSEDDKTKLVKKDAEAAATSLVISLGVSGIMGVVVWKEIIITAAVSGAVASIKEYVEQEMDDAVGRMYEEDVAIGSTFHNYMEVKYYSDSIAFVERYGDMYQGLGFYYTQYAEGIQL